MKQRYTLFLLGIFCLGAFVSSCCRNQCEVWDDTKSASRHFSKGVRTMGGKHGDSRQVRCKEEFCTSGPSEYDLSAFDFVPLMDEDRNGEIAMADLQSRPSRYEPGESGGRVPGIEAFKDPSLHPETSGIFKNIHFPFDSSLIKGKENLGTIRAIADYMRQHPDTYVFVEGHCDERGPAAYNLALGTRRANAVRNLLIQEGVNADNLFTVSYGKERPLLFEHNDNAWTQNRRTEFKIYHHF